MTQARLETGPSMMDSRARDEAAQRFVRLQDAEPSSDVLQQFEVWR